MHKEKMMIREVLVILVIAGGIVSCTQGTSTPPIEDLVAQLDSLALLGEKAERSFADSIEVQIENNPAQVAEVLLTRLADTSLYERQKAVYVWAIGLTEERGAVDAIIELHRQSKTNELKTACMRALSAVGGNTAGEYLTALYDSESDKDKQYVILNLLGQMKHEPALSRMETVLRQDPNEFYWQPIFVFGKMGDPAVPFLLARIGHNNRDVRANAVNVVGQWLVPTEASVPLQERYWLEEDAELRGMILSALERTTTNLDSMQAFFEKVVSAEKDKQLAQFAGETIATMDQLREAVKSFAQKKKVSSEDFAREYTKLYLSSGLEGDYEVLANSSTSEDEAKLKELRERILQRDSDEAFYDYQKVSDIIIYNRLAAGLE